jgi:hypothetical protein
MFLELGMVDKSENGLEKQQTEHNNPNNRMVMIDQLSGNAVDDPYPQAEGTGVDDVREDLEQTVNEPDSRERTETDEDGSHREEDYESEGREDAMCDELLFALGKERCKVEAAKSTSLALTLTAAVTTSVATSRPIVASGAVLCCY